MSSRSTDFRSLRATLRARTSLFGSLVTAACILQAAYLVWVVLARGPEGLVALAASAGSVFLSKFAIFAGAIEQHPHGPWELGAIAWFIDVAWACALLGGLGWMERLPIVERYLGQARAHAARMAREYPGIGRMASAGVGLFVFLPIPGTGAIAGTLLGSLLGLSRTRCLLSVATGSALAVTLFAALATVFGRRWQAIVQNPVTSLVCLVALVAFAHWAWHRTKRNLRRAT